MRSLEDPARPRIAAAAGLIVRWSRLALLTGLVILAAMISQELFGWPAWVAAGVLGAVFMATVVRSGRPADSSFLIRQSEAGWAALHAELARSRRHDRRFAVLRIPESVWATPGGSHDAVMEDGLRAAGAVHALLRRPDRAWIDGTDLNVLVTDCDRQQAWSFLRRARASLPQLFADERVQLAVFPEDGVTLGTLLESRTPSADGLTLVEWR
jgi:hypothetical protein